jgi:hypothetical protein
MQFLEDHLPQVVRIWYGNSFTTVPQAVWAMRQAMLADVVSIGKPSVSLVT